MTDEMDLISELKGAEPLRPEAYQRARAVLRAAMAEPGTVRVLGATSAEGTTMGTTPVQDRGFTPAAQRRRKIGPAGRVGIGAGVGVAAAAAIALVVDRGRGPGGGQGPRGGLGGDGYHRRASRRFPVGDPGRPHQGGHPVDGRRVAGDLDSSRRRQD